MLSGGHLENAAEEGGLRVDVVTADVVNLPLSDRHRLIAGQCLQAVRKLPKPSPGRTGR